MKHQNISEHAFIGDGVTLGKNVSVGPFAVILGPCKIEDNVWIGPGAQIGAPPEISSLEQNTAWTGGLTHSGVHIGAGAVIREGAVIHQGSYRATSIGAGSWILNRAYIAHDVMVGDATTVSAGVSIGGHCLIGDTVNIGMNASVHQRRIIATGAMIGMGTPVTGDVPPFAKVYGSPARLTGVNAVGMQRSGITHETVETLEDHYRNGRMLAIASSIDPPELAEPLRWWQNTQPSKIIRAQHQ